MKILTINIWRYYEWEKRKKNMIKFLKEQNADIVFLQEVAYDERLKGKWSDQIREINEPLKYANAKFGKLMEMKEWHNQPISWIMYYGFGILSKYPIVSSEVVVLPPVEKNKKFGFMHVIIGAPEGPIDLVNVHFENTDAGSREHLKQTLEWCKEKGKRPIIAGDFNMKRVETLKKLVEKEYEISYMIKSYTSFMPTKFSHNQVPITLDYIITHKDKFEMKNIECISNNISDHNPIIAEIRVKKTQINVLEK